MPGIDARIGGALMGLAWAGVVCVDAQGITAVTRRTFMAGPYPVGVAPGWVVSPQSQAAAATLTPMLSVPRVPPGASVVSPGPVVAPVAQPDPAVQAARKAAAEAAVLAFQQEQARKGSPSAQLALGRRYLTGEGLPRNPGLARVWLEAAKRNGMDEAGPLLETLPEAP